MSLANDLTNRIEDIFFTELLAAEKRDSTIDDNLVYKFNNTNVYKIDLVDKQRNFNDGQVDLMKMIVHCTQK